MKLYVTTHHKDVMFSTRTEVIFVGLDEDIAQQEAKDHPEYTDPYSRFKIQVWEYNNKLKEYAV